MLSAGDRIKHYEIIRLIGEGGMGAVYLALDSVLDRKVAIKFLSEELEGDPRFRDRFVHEAKSAAALDHPFICQIHETGEVDGKAYIVMEYVEGVTLRKRMEDRAVSLPEALRIALEIAEALEVAHAKGIVHRDLKPANIMLTPQGHAKVMDFGLAKRFLPGGADLTRTLTQVGSEEGAIVGTLAYMSPEQARGETLDGRSDIFSLGIILDEMISGKHPFSKPTPMETLTSVLRDAPPPVRVSPRSADASVSQIVLKALAKDLPGRYQKIAELAGDIRKLSGELATAGGSLRRWAKVAGSLLLAVAVFVVLWRFVLRPERGGAPVPHQTITVLVADFQNLTGDPDFDGTLEQPMGISLEESPFISVYKHPQAHAVARQLSSSADDRLDADRALLVSRREGINAVVAASVSLSNRVYAVSARAVDPASGKLLVRADQASKTKAGVLQATHDLAVGIGAKLSRSSPQSVAALSRETFSASSLEAMQAYSKGQDLAQQGRDEEAILEYQAAIAADPKMGRAYSGLATAYWNTGLVRDAERYFQLAMVNIDRMTEREKYRTSGAYYLFKQDYQKAIEKYGALIDKYPADGAGLPNLAIAYFGARRMADALVSGQKALDADPKDTTNRYNLGWYAMGSGNFELARTSELEVIKENPGFAEAYLVIGLAELALGHRSEAAEEYLKLEAIGAGGTSLASTASADLAIYEGRLDQAVSILNAGISADVKNGRGDDAADKLVMLADVLMEEKLRAQAVECADRALAAGKSESVMFAAGRVYLQAGKEIKARAIQAELGTRVQPINQVYAKLLEGELRLRTGDAPGAIRLYREAEAILDTWLGRLLLGAASIEMGAFTEAYLEFDLCLKRRGEAASVFMNDLPSFRYLPQVYYYLGRAQEGLGSPAAAQSYRAFLEIKDKSSGLPLVEDAKKRLAGLKGG